MKEHLKKWAKAYAAGGAVLVMQPFAADIMTILIWLLGLIGLTPPELVIKAGGNLLTALVGGGTAGFVTNKE